MTSSAGILVDQPRFNFTTDNFKLILGVSSGETYEQLDETIVKIEAFQSEAAKNKEGWLEYKTTPLKLEICDFSKFTSFHSEIFKGTPTYNMLCLADNFNIQGSYFSPIYNSLKIKISECTNSTESQKCKSKAEIDKQLKFGYFSFAHTDINIDPTNYTTPNQIYNGNAFLAISNREYREALHIQKLVRINTDKAWLFEDITTENYIQTETASNIVLQRPSVNFLNYFFRFNIKVDTYNRSYTKVQNVAANVGGIIKIFVIICQSLVKIYGKTKYLEYVINKLFNLKNEKEHVKEKEQKSGNVSSMRFFKDYSDMNNLNNVNIIHESKLQIGNILPMTNTSQKFNPLPSQPVVVDKNKILLGKNNKAHKMDFGYLKSNCLFIMPWCLRNNHDAKMFIKAKEKFYLDSDIIKIFGKLHNYDLLKRILLDDDVNQMLNLPHKSDVEMTPNLMTPSKDLMKIFEVIKDRANNNDIKCQKILTELFHVKKN
jgi:hypothetical protein